MIWIAAALLLAGLGFVLIILINDQGNEKRELDRVDKQTRGKAPAPIEEFLLDNGVELPGEVVNASLAIIVSSIAISFVFLPFEIALIVSASIAGVALLSVKTIGSRRRQKMLEQLPSFINQVTRRLSSGTSVENAFADSVETLERPLGTIMRRVVRRVSLGYDLHTAFAKEARTNKVKEFEMLATALRINEQYGGSIRSILDDIVDILRMQDSGKRELSAMTGETRVTAFVLASIPPGVAAYLFTMNRTMITNTWEDPSGKNMLIAAAALQIIGVVSLWRMIKSVST